MADAEAHLGAEGGRQQFARDLGRVDRRRRLEAIVAIAAALRRVLAEMAKQHRAAAAGGLDQRGQRVEPLALGRAALGLDLGARSAGGPARSPRRPRTATPPPARRRARRGRSPDNKPRSTWGWPAWATKRTSGLSMPMPKATVAAITISSDCDEGRLVARAHLRLEPGMIGQRRPAARGRAARRSSRPCRGSAHRRSPGPGCVGEQLAQLLAGLLARGGRDSGCSAGRTRRRSARRRGCRAGRGCRRGSARRRSRSAPGAARPGSRRAGRSRR